MRYKSVICSSTADDAVQERDMFEWTHSIEFDS